MPTTESGLTPKQQRFVEEYLIDLNATAAARRAGYLGTYAALRVTASNLVAKPNVRRAIEKAFRARQRRTQIDGDEELRHAQRMSRNPDLPPSVAQKYHESVLRFVCTPPALQLQIESREELRIAVEVNRAVEEVPEVIDADDIGRAARRAARRLAAPG
ncbi:MAG: terminase small subunit [Planctomycetes bacterium]|nr:terminase small subunit [Planctomycetota bacterium]